MSLSNMIVDGYLNEFKSTYGEFGTKDESILFEHFINYLIIKSEFTDDISIERLSVGGGSDLGIDGICILVNNFIAYDLETAKTLSEELFKGKPLAIDYVFVQSKTSASFDCAEIGNFFEGVECFFMSSECVKPKNMQIESFINVSRYLYSLSSRFAINPTIKCCYVTLGKYIENNDFRHKRDKFCKCLENMNLFSDIKISFIDASAIQKTYKETELKIEKEIVLEKQTTLPSLDNIKEAYLGVLPIKEYLKLITDDSGNIIRGLFYDNVRDYQGGNPVNTEIIETVKSDIKRKYFGLFNNGITIVAKSLQKIGDKIKLNNFQIVNGCQTSNIVCNNKEYFTNNHGNAYITLKIISTDDSEIINDIIRATNRQTEVKPEAFESLYNFHKTLEQFYMSYNDKLPANKKIYYERRSKQYAQQSDIQKCRVATLTTEIKAYISMFLNQPHSMHRYYGELLSSNKNLMFLGDDNLHPYFACALAYIEIDRLFATGKIAFEYKPFKFHFLTMFRQRLKGHYTLRRNERGNEKYSVELINVLIDDDRLHQTINALCDVLNRALDGENVSNYYSLARSKDFTNKLVDLIN